MPRPLTMNHCGKRPRVLGLRSMWVSYVAQLRYDDAQYGGCGVLWGGGSRLGGSCLTGGGVVARNNQQVCAERNVHGYDAAALEQLQSEWEPIPTHMKPIDLTVWSRFPLSSLCHGRSHVAQY